MGFDYYLLDNMTITNEIKYSKPEKLSITNQQYTEPINYEEESKEQKSDNNYDFSYLFEFDREFKDPDQSLDFSINVNTDVDEETKDLLVENQIVNGSEFNEDYFHRRHSMKPGVTGLWQVRGRNKIKDFNNWVKLDLEYIDNWSFMLDFKIAVRTFFTVASGTGI